jgi:hypothetical protein
VEVLRDLDPVAAPARPRRTPPAAAGGSLPTTGGAPLVVLLGLLLLTGSVALRRARADLP